MKDSDYLTGPEISLLLSRAPALRRQAGVSAREIASALGIRKALIYRWDAGHKPRDRAEGMRYVRVILGLQRHCEIEETHDGHWDWD